MMCIRQIIARTVAAAVRAEKLPSDPTDRNIILRDPSSNRLTPQEPYYEEIQSKQSNSMKG
jgi:hypothetical protein